MGSQACALKACLENMSWNVAGTPEQSKELLFSHRFPSSSPLLGLPPSGLPPCSPGITGTGPKAITAWAFYVLTLQQPQRGKMQREA